MAQNPRPILKLKVGKGLAATAGPASSASPTQTPTSGTPKLKLKFGGVAKVKSEPSDSSAAVASQPSPKIKLTTKKSKPKSIKLNTKKRDHDEIAEPGEKDGAQSATSAGPKKIKFMSKPRTPHTPYLKLKPKGKPPPRPRGLAYDSEASDREDDPAIEEEFILRMVPGDDCEYIRKAIEEKRWGPRSQGGADIRLKFLQADGRRAVLYVRGTIYAAALVDMPNIVEGMKSWDRKAWYKAADICQMVLVLGTVTTEGEAANYPLPPGEVDKESMAYAHGLTPPLRWVRKRRFRPRVSTRTIEAVEEEVDRLLRLDAEAEGNVDYEVVDMDRLSRGPSGRGDSEQPGDDSEDAEGDMDTDANFMDPEDYFNTEIGDEDEEDLAAEFMAEGDDGDGMEAATPAESSNGAQDTQNVTDSEAATPAAGATSKEDSGDEESDDDDDMDDMDEDAMEQKADLKRAREEISDLEAAIKAQIADMEKLTNDLLKKRKLKLINTLKEDLERKKAEIGEGDDD